MSYSVRDLAEILHIASAVNPTKPVVFVADYEHLQVNAIEEHTDCIVLRSSPQTKEPHE